ncbi:23S rRNA (pseudouridine(1915)-N(3))-methyltransferase RlmH [Paenibacillus chitinolyticus]|nr:23S rRNA (pseudouridine(1915)-N(3))-methyltransferase RlmH [Paenibacillus chitinolyticus]
MRVICRADKKLSFGRVTSPHKMMRVMVLEQVYRGH